MVAVGCALVLFDTGVAALVGDGNRLDGTVMVVESVAVAPLERLLPDALLLVAPVVSMPVKTALALIMVGEDDTPLGGCADMLGSDIKITGFAAALPPLPLDSPA